MSGVAFEFYASGLKEAILAIEGIENAPTHELTEGLGRLVQTQTRRRIEEEKTAPDGTPWKPNAAGTSILYDTGELSRSIDYLASPDEVEVGSGLVYARIHQEGGKIEAKNAKALAFMLGGELRLVQSVTLPARTYLGISDDNREEILETVEDWLGGLVQ